MNTATVVSTAKSPVTRWWDLPAALLLLAAIITATIRLAATNWTEDLSIVQLVAVPGFVLGLALGLSVFRRRMVIALSVAYGSYFIFWQLGSTLGQGILWSERLVSVSGRLGVSLLQLIQRKPVTDPLLFVALMTLLFWILSQHAGYTLARFAQPWQASLPTGLALFIIHIHDPYWPYRTWFLATYLFFALLLLARVTFLQRQSEWKRAHTRLPPYLGLDLIRVTLLVTAILVLVAWTAPALASSVPLAERAWKQLSRPWVVARSRMSNAFASLRASVGLVYDYYGDSLPLGRGNRLTDDIILTIEGPNRPEEVRRYYWRARVYDTYDSGLWQGNYDETALVAPQNFDLPVPQAEERWDATFDVTTFVPLSTLFTIPQPQWVSRPARVDLARNPDGSVDLGAIHAEVNVQPGETYQVRASISAATENQLRTAGTEYPQWILDRYLQLPETITQRTRDLAERITGPFDNPYDKAVAVTSYLRNNIRYSDTVPVPPADQDPVDWVLFDLQQGFCNYYATSEVILLRSVGIPARWAVGYAEGTFDQGTETYQVRQRDAHSWPEVYFPGIGWTEFEPTLSQPTLERPVGEPIEENEFEPINPDAAPGSVPGLDTDIDELLGLEQAQEVEVAGGIAGANPLLTLGLAVAGLALIAVSLFAWRTNRIRLRQPFPVMLEFGFKRIGLRPPRFLLQWAKTARLSPLARAYNEVNHALGRLDSRVGPQATPAERALSLEALLPAAGQPIRNLVGEYQKGTYSPRAGDEQIAQESARTIWKLSWLARIQRLIARWQEAPSGAKPPPLPR